MKLLRKILTGMLAGVLALGSVSAQAFAAGLYSRPDIDRETSLEIHYHQRDIDFENVEFQVYKIADMAETVKFDFVRRFEDYPIDFQDEMTASQWVNMAEVLAGYVLRDGLKPDYAGTTDAKGRYAIPGLDASLYLVIGGSHQREYRTTEKGESVLHRVYYHAAPFLIATPSLDENNISDSEWIYDVEVSPKFTASEDEFISRRILKTWDDAGYESQRPGALLFDLICDGEVQETVELTAGDLWRYQWDELDNTHQWRIVEHAAGNYRVSARQEGITYVVTNRYNYPSPTRPDRPSRPSIDSTDPDPVTPVPPATDIPDTNPPQTDIPNVPTDANKPGKPGIDIPETDIPKTDIPKLPQTGQLWWPVPVLAFSGLCLFITGWLSYKKRRED